MYHQLVKEIFFVNIILNRNVVAYVVSINVAHGSGSWGRVEEESGDRYSLYVKYDV